MQDSEPGSDAKIKDYFVNVVHISGDNYDKMKASLIKQAVSLKSRVNSRDVLVDMDFEGTMKKLYAKEIEAAQAKKSAREAGLIPTPPKSVTTTSIPQN